MSVEPTKDDSDALIENLQKANTLVRSRAVVLSLFLVFMLGFALSIGRSNRERRDLEVCYNHLKVLLNSDSLRTILSRDSLAYFYRAEKLGEYMSLEVLYDRLTKDSFNNPEALYEAINTIDEQWRITGRKKDEATLSLFGFSMPIEPVMLVTPILLLLLYHDFSVIMLYRKRLENKMSLKKLDVWRAGPETVGHYMLGFVPHKFRYVKWLWSVFQIVILFLPMIPAVYFCLYNGDVAPFIVAINFLCCLGILVDFLIVVDSENILGLRDLSLLVTGRSRGSSSREQRRLRTIIIGALPFCMGLITWGALHNIIPFHMDDLWGCIIYAMLASLVMGLFSLLFPQAEKKKIYPLVSGLASGGFFASLYWFVIDLLAAVDAIQFRFLDPWDYVLFSIIIFFAATLVKIFYIIGYLPQPEKNTIDSPADGVVADE